MKQTILRIDLKTLRQKRGLAYREASEAIGITRNAIFELERGITSPTELTLKKIVDVLKLTEAEIKKYITINYNALREHKKIN